MRKLLFAILLSFPATAQQPQPSTAAPAPLISPEILPDHRVTFRLRAPQAPKVSLSGDFWLQQGRTEDLTRDSQGVWSLTTETLPADFYSYFFTVDGVHLPDPANGQIKPGIAETQSTFLIPGPETSLLSPALTAQGDIHPVYYRAASLGKIRRMHVYLPPGYDKGAARYPVLYLFHGGGDDDSAWESIGRVNLILDNLIAQGKAKPMIVVMPSLWALDTPIPADRRVENEDLFQKTLFSDVIPYVEAHYRVLPGRANRAAGGLGAGRDFLPNLIWPNLSRFGTVLFVSGGADADHYKAFQAKYPGVLENPKNIAHVRFFMGDGVHDNSFASAKYMSDALKRLGYHVDFVQSETTHGWPGFRYVFERFAPTAFR